MKPPYWYPGFGNDWLDSIHEVDISALGEVSLLPDSFLELPPGIILVLVLLMLLTGTVLVKKFKAWRWFAFQRRALRILNEMEGNYAKGDSLAVLNKLLKQSVMHLTGRESIAPLSGKRWCEKFMEVQSIWSDGKACLSPDDIVKFEYWSYQKDDGTTTVEEGLLLISKLKDWLRSLIYREDLVNDGVRK